MSFIEIDLTGVKEPETAPEGPYSLHINDVLGYVKEKQADGTGGNYVIRCRIGFDGRTEFRTFNHYLSFPGPADDAEGAERKKLNIARFLTMTNCPFDPSKGFDENDLQGITFPGKVGLDEPNQQGDVYNRLFLDRLPGELAAA
jgi:hypothetical protein